MLVRAVLALESNATLNRFQNILSDKDLLVSVLDPKNDVWKKLPHMNSDIIVIDHSLISNSHNHKLNILTRLPESPEILIIMNQEDPEERARLIATGCRAALIQDTASNKIERTLDSLIKHRMESGVNLIVDRITIPQPRLSDFVSKSPTMQSFMRLVNKVTQTSSSILIQGETGVGKERLARAIHSDGPRSDMPFIAVNCGAMPESLMESELFGHEEGAFTGATRSRRGCFELAHNGTLFLDEIGEMPTHLQVKLLRVLQDQEIQRVGGERTIKVNVRIIAATSRNLEKAIQETTFRSDLYYRLNVMTLNVPPLRDRKADIPDLVESYVNYFRPTINHHVHRINADVLDALCNYSWPGNVRELINVVERALILSDGTDLTMDELPLSVISEYGESTEQVDILDGNIVALPANWDKLRLADLTELAQSRVEKKYLEKVLSDTNGRIGKTADQAGIQTRTLFNKMKLYGLDKKDYKE